MDKFSYNSYPDSAESSPRSRDVEFENPPPWEDHQQQQQQSYKVKLMCSYGGKIQPRPHDNQLTYVNGDTKIMSVDRGIRFPSLVSKLSAVTSGGGGGGDGGGEISFKYQLPGEDLDALISVTNDEDLEHMMHEYDRLLRMSSKPARMRLFLFPSSPNISGGFGSEGSTKSDRDTLLNPIPSRPESEKSVSAADFLFGSEKSAAPIPPSPVKVPQPVQEPAVLEPPMFVDQRMLQPDHGVNPAEIQRQIHEFQRIQIRDQQEQQQQQQQQQMLHQNQLHQQQQQEAIHQNQLLQQQQEAMHQNQLLQQQQQQEAAMYRRKSEDEGGRYFSPTYAQNPAAATSQNQQPPIGYWQGNNNIPGNVYATTTSQNLPEQQQQQVYMIPAQSQSPGTIYQSVMRPPTVQGSYYPPVQRMHPHPDAYMEQQNQSGYNVVQPQPPYSGGPQVMTSVGGPQVMTSVGPIMGLQEPYSQMGKPVYYTVAGDGMMVQPPPPQPQQQQQQYQGVGQPVSGMTDLRTGPDGKVVNMAAPKVTDSV
ncbi:PREDICTED: alpha-protein kinase 1-like [Camelina sativa]|uniref:Alpha-protein kinase 1-like n=1 Tax=Camelina sativa TaxID=90675 RepID=A0ABM0XVG9_CAMSA|nr:PREDICTED: alpha-protein kinase 1-like [Camelina sativa]